MFSSSASSQSFKTFVAQSVRFDVAYISLLVALFKSNNMNLTISMPSLELPKVKETLLLVQIVLRYQKI